MITDNIVTVLCWFDDEQTMPASYVLKWSDGFEAFVHEMKKHEDDGQEWADPISLGRYATRSEAASAIHNWNRCGAYETINTDGDGFDFNRPRGH